MRFYILLILLLFSPNIFSQKYAFKNYTHLDGLPQDFIYSITQDRTGLLIVGTGDGLSYFNGKTFKNYSKKDGLSENVITAVNKSNSQILIGHNNGGISLINENKIKNFDGVTTSKSAIIGIGMLKEHLVYLSQNEGLFILKNKKCFNIFHKKNEIFSSMLIVDEKQILVGTSAGLYLLKIENEKLSSSNLILAEGNISFISDSDGSNYYIGIEGQGAKKINFKSNKYAIHEFELNKEIENKGLVITNLLKDKVGNYWLATMNKGLFKFSYNSFTKNYTSINYNAENGLSSNFIKSLYIDHEDNIWAGSFGNGLMRKMDNFFIQFTHKNNEQPFDVISYCETSAGKWYGLSYGLLYKYSDSLGVHDFYFEELNGKTITTLKENKNNIYIGTLNNGLFYYNSSTKKITKKNWNLTQLERSINDIEIIDDDIWVSTQGGLIYNSITNEAQLEIFGTESGLPHNVISCLKIDNEGNLLIGTKSNSLLKLKDGELTEIGITSTGILNIIDIAVDQNNNYWLATSENGVIKIENGKVSSFNEMNGLKTNYCYAIEQDLQQNIWIGHSNGLSKITKDGIKIYGLKDGINSRVNFRSIYNDEEGFLWIGTSEALIQYNYQNDRKNIYPPLINLISIELNDAKITKENAYFFSSGSYKIKINFQGISFKNPEDITYRYKLEGYDNDFSAPTNNDFVTYGNVSAGNYILKVIVCNGDGVCSEEITFIEIEVDKPIYQKLWFQILLFFVLIIIVIVVIKIRTYQYKQRQIELQHALNIATEEIVDQKTKIENINKDLTDSINYAKRIQTKILTDTDELTSMFPGSFIYFKPRDIVSGDFYYLARVDSKYYIICADCTGHGVPGAFMTFIGRVSIRNYFQNHPSEVVSPRDLLEFLNEEVEQILQQDEEYDDINYDVRDGMDLVICEVDLIRHEIKIASAMRPFVLKQNDQLFINKGSRFSIGGGMFEEKSFEEFTYRFRKGDELYLFSDGVTDQFGGPNNKKLKIDGLIEKINQLEGDNSAENLKKFDQFYSDFMGDNFQLDDISLIVIKF